MKFKALALASVLILASVAIGASAFTSATMNRDATMAVTTDANGLIGLEDGTSGPLVASTTSGELAINFDDPSTTATEGVNNDAKYTFGNGADPTNQSAFNITNNAQESLSLDLSYSASSTAATDGTYDNVNFKVYDSTGTLVNTVTENTGQTVTIGSGKTYYVVLVVDTTGTDVASGDSLSGALQINA